jgi:large-conductance mechanosensitive channel
MSRHVPLPSERSFGLTFVAFFAVVAAWQAWAGRPVVAMILGGAAASTLLVTLVRPLLLRPLNRAWMKLGALMHAVVNPVVLGAMFFVVIAPIGIVMRLFGRDALRRRLDPHAPSYWVRRDPPGPAPDSLPNQF